MLKKIFATLIVLLSIIGVQNFSYNVCNAEFPESEYSLGGIGLIRSNGIWWWASVVEKIYGPPTTESGPFGNGTWIYGDSVKIGFYEGKVCSIEVTANNGWKTPSGLGVGMKIDDAKRRYGEPSYIKTNGNKILHVYGGLFVVANRNDGKITYLGMGIEGNDGSEESFLKVVERLLK